MHKEHEQTTIEKDRLQQQLELLVAELEKSQVSSYTTILFVSFRNLKHFNFILMSLLFKTN